MTLTNKLVAALKRNPDVQIDEIQISHQHLIYLAHEHSLEWRADGVQCFHGIPITVTSNLDTDAAFVSGGEHVYAFGLGI